MTNLRDSSTLIPSILKAIQAKITAGELREGEVIHQTELAKELGVSPVPIREALRSLEVAGIVTFLPFRGTIITPVTSAEIAECFLIGIALGTRMLPLAAPRFTTEDLARLRVLADHLDRGEATLEEFFAFYHQLLRPADLPLCQQIITNVLARLNRVFALASVNLKALTETRPLRAEIIDALAEGDSPKAVEIFTRFHEIRRDGLIKLFETKD